MVYLRRNGFPNMPQFKRCTELNNFFLVGVPCEAQMFRSKEKPPASPDDGALPNSSRPKGLLGKPFAGFFCDKNSFKNKLKHLNLQMRTECAVHARPQTPAHFLWHQRGGKGLIFSCKV